MDISCLPAALIEKIERIVFDFEACNLKELTNLSCVSRQAHHDVEPFLYAEKKHKWFTLTCKCSNQLKQSDTAYLCKPFCDKQGYTFDWRCYECTMLSKLNRRGKGLGKGGMKISSYGVVDVYDPTYRTCSAVVRSGSCDFKFCRGLQCTHAK